jgi:hypothetical protein
MKEIPVLFSTIMVQANMEDRKDMTRRLVKFRNRKWRLSYEANEPGRTDLDAFGVLNEHGNLIEIEEGQPGTLKELGLCPYGQPGDILWVRETFLTRTPRGDMGKFGYKADFKHSWKGPLKWKPSIFMPKEAARIWLQVTDVRIERLHDITEEDAIAEGIEKRLGSTSETRFDYKHYIYGTYDVSAQVSFRTLWEAVNDPDSWVANPWVWVVKYKILSKTGRPETFPVYVKETVR